MAKSKKRKAMMGGMLMAVLLTAVASFLAQTTRKEAAPSQQSSHSFPEKEKEQSTQSKLISLLSSFGMRVGPGLETTGAQRYRELRFNWESLQKTGMAGFLKAEQLSAAGELTRISSSSKAGGLPRERSMELSPDHILVVAVDKNDTVRWWKLMIDPRLVRAEIGRSDEMRSENLYQANVDFIVECPEDLVLEQLRFYRPVWNGESFQLEPWGVASLR